jgi:hypothetical protein
MPYEPDVTEESDPNAPTASTGEPRQDDLTDELVKQVTERVYAMLVQDLTLERERQRPYSRAVRSRGGW